MNDEAIGDMSLGGDDGGPKDPFADTPADGGLGDEPTSAEAVPPPPGEGLGGDGAAIGEEAQLPVEPEDAINGGAEEPLPDGPAADPLAEPTPAEVPTPEPEPEPEPEPPAPEEAKAEPKKAPAKKAAKGDGKKGTSERTYKVLQRVVGEDGTVFWTEPLPEGVVAGNGEQAIRKAYSQLVAEDSGDEITLSVVPEHFWNPKTVAAKVRHERAVEIS